MKTFNIDFTNKCESITVLTTCKWEIKVETGKEILMRIGDLDIEGPNDDCQQGNVVFYEGIGKSREKMGLLDFSLFFCKF